MEKEMLKELLIKSKNLQKKAYAPYSNFRVASIVTLNNGEQINGVNVENAAYPVTICAERTALSQVIAQGYKKNDIKSLFLITDSITIGSPCGVCRQFMCEIMPENALVYIASKNTTNVEDIKKIKVLELLPLAFLPSSLKEE